MRSIPLNTDFLCSFYKDISATWINVKPSNRYISGDGVHEMSPHHAQLLSEAGLLIGDISSSLFDIPQVYTLK